MSMLAKWLVPTFVYVLAVGSLGVTSKLALRTLPWQTLVMWTGIGYLAVTGLLLGLGQAKLNFVHDTPWAMLSGAMAIGGLVSLYLALNTGEASKVVTVSAAYPAVTVVLAALTLSESVSLARVGGLCLVVGGVIVLTVAR
jgi:transporter family protein